MKSVDGFFLFIYSFYYNTIKNYILITCEPSNCDHVHGVESQIRVFGGNRDAEPHANSLAHYALDYQGPRILLHFNQFLLYLIEWNLYKVPTYVFLLASCPCSVLPFVL